ncbi:Uncharacterized protein ChrSV_1288 [Chromobacterium vaccinii]|nr:Uncharacterized protein ChrSW_1288 [Chromobacterium vaccinii]QND88746.1 Uncharacterized protein ChrSV_1288 [Chromobacterium vaccinii]
MFMAQAGRAKPRKTPQDDLTLSFQTFTNAVTLLKCCFYRRRL